MPTPCGHLIAIGTLFMSGPIYEQRTDAGELQFVLPLVQRDGAGVTSVRAIWSGPRAGAWMQLHRHRCRRGQPLLVSFARIWCRGNELHGAISSCEFAPGRWEVRNSNSSNHITTTTTNTEETAAP